MPVVGFVELPRLPSDIPDFLDQVSFSQLFVKATESFISWFNQTQETRLVPAIRAGFLRCESAAVCCPTALQAKKRKLL
jgi:hypothetical protein